MYQVGDKVRLYDSKYSETFFEGIVKERYAIAIGKHLWEVDEFFEDNEGLVIAEIELSEPNEEFEKPDWIGDEVSDDPRYFNSYLVEKPYKFW